MKIAWVERRLLPLVDSGCWLDTDAIPAELATVVHELGRQDWEVNLVLASDAVVADLNQRYRGVEGVTDVLSFAYLESKGEGEPDLIAGCGGAAVDLWRSDPSDVVGEIVLAPDFVVKRCRAEGWSLTAEFSLLVLHGCLHLLGWDHQEAGLRAAMRKLETDLLAEMGLTHPLAN